MRSLGKPGLFCFGDTAERCYLSPDSGTKPERFWSEAAALAVNFRNLYSDVHGQDHEIKLGRRTDSLVVD
jgi:hypothetical protein